jgi:acetoin utilization deacetylase AcuC-like enzyme
MHVVYDPAHLQHAPEFETDGGYRSAAFEVTERAELIKSALAAEAVHTFVTPSEHGTAPIEAVHDPRMVAFLSQAWEQFAALKPGRSVLMADSYNNAAYRAGMGAGHEPKGILGRTGYWAQDTATPIMAGTYPAARAAVDVALSAADLVLGGATVAYGLCRPPGHHAAAAMFAGYCYFNNAAIVAHDLVGRTGQRVAVLDVDYHHGNGTQQIFYERDDVFFVSLHADPDRAYPYFSGWADEVGAGRGRGQTFNLPQPARADDDLYLKSVERAADAIASAHVGSLVVSLGVDTFDGDPISDLAVSTPGFARIGASIARLGLPTVVVQEGGYNLEHLGANVTSFLGGIARG